MEEKDKLSLDERLKSAKEVNPTSRFGYYVNRAVKEIKFYGNIIRSAFIPLDKDVYIDVESGDLKIECGPQADSEKKERT